MALGPGKYDDECTKAREATGGNVLLIVLGGNKGTGFACHATKDVLDRLPNVLRKVAEDIEKIFAVEEMKKRIRSDGRGD